MTNYNKMTNEDFDRILTDILSKKTASEILLTPGAYEVFSEALNNEVLDAWEEEQLDAWKAKQDSDHNKDSAHWTEEERQDALTNNTSDWYLVDCEDGSTQLKNATELSSIIECGASQRLFGIKAIHRCGRTND